MPEPQYLYDNDPWMLGEDIPDCDLFFSQIWLVCFINVFVKNTGRAYKKILCKYEGYHLWFYFGQKDSFEVGQNIVDRILHEDGYAETVNKNIVLEADKLRAFSEMIPQENLQKLSNQELCEIYQKQDEIHKEYYTWAWIPVAVDMFHNNLTNAVKEYLRSLQVSPEKINEYLVILTQPTEKSLIFIEQEELLKIAIEIEKESEHVSLFRVGSVDEIFQKVPENILALLEKHRAKYYYTKHLWVSGEYTLLDYVKQVKEIFGSQKSAKDILRVQYEELENVRVAKEDLMQKLDIDQKWQKIFQAFGDFMITKIYRRYAQIFAMHHMSPILREIAKRKYLTEKQVRFMLPEEVRKMLLENKYNPDELLFRTKLCVFYAEKDVNAVFTGEKAKELLKDTEHIFDTEDIEELRGEIGCVGSAKGKVKIVIRAGDMDKMEEGDVLVSIATDPDIVPAMKKAVAIVTEQGGVTSHAAIVSRELKIPCVIGTKIATKVFKDGDMVEVDAIKGVVRKIIE